MAVDTAGKRFSLVGFGSPVPSVLPIPDGAIDAEDKADFLYLYSGITLSDVVEIWTIQSRDASLWTIQSRFYVSPGYYTPSGYIEGDEGMFVTATKDSSVWTVVSG